MSFRKIIQKITARVSQIGLKRFRKAVDCFAGPVEAFDLHTHQYLTGNQSFMA